MISYTKGFEIKWMGERLHRAGGRGDRKEGRGKGTREDENVADGGI
jgi:hypothetical protein